MSDSTSKLSSEIKDVISLDYADPGELPPFPMDAMPETIRRYIHDVADDCQASMAAAISLGVLAVCLQKKYKVEVNSDWREPLNLYVVVAADPESGRTAVLNAMAGSLSDYEDSYNRKHRREYAERDEKRDELKKRISKLRRVCYGTGSGKTNFDAEMERHLDLLEDELENTPKLKPLKLFSEECSAISLVHSLNDNHGKFSIISEDNEFESLFGPHSDWNKRGIWISGYSGERREFDRVQDGKIYSYRVDNPALSSILIVRPEAMDRILAKSKKNEKKQLYTLLEKERLLSRFLFSYGCVNGYKNSRSKLSVEALDTDRRNYNNLIYRLMDIPTEKEERLFHISHEAMELYTVYYDSVERYLGSVRNMSSEDPFISWLAKHAGMVLRIAGLLHGAEMDPDDAKDNTIDVSTMNRAVQIGKYFLAQARRAYSVMAPGAMY